MQFFSAGQLSNGGHDRNEIWHKGSLGWGWCPNVEYAHNADKVCDTTLYGEKSNLPHIRGRPIDRMCAVVTALWNQPEAFASHLGDDQSRYLLVEHVQKEQLLYHVLSTRCDGLHYEYILIVYSMLLLNVRFVTLNFHVDLDLTFTAVMPSTERQYC